MNRFSRYTGHPIVGRGDLVEAIGSRDEDTLRAVADQLGMRYVTKVPEVVDKIVFKDSAHVLVVPGKIDSSAYPNSIKDMAIWMLTHFQISEPLPTITDGPAYTTWTKKPTVEPD